MGLNGTYFVLDNLRLRSKKIHFKLEVVINKVASRNAEIQVAVLTVTG